MRKFIKTVAVLALAVAVLSTSAFAALTGELTVNNNGTYTVKITGAEAEDQVTILAVDTEDLASVTDENIYYIDENADGMFSNFQLKDDENIKGKEIFLFAGSTSSDFLKLDESIENLKITINAPKTEVEIGEEVEISAGVEGGTPETIVWTAGEATITPIGNGAAGATFVATEAGEYTVKVTMDGVDSNEVTINVTAPSYDLERTAYDVIDTTPDGVDVEAQYGVGVMIEVNVPVAFDKMIWVLVDDQGHRYYSDAVDYLGGAQGAVKYYAAFANGNNDTTQTLNITGVDAIFRVDANTEYYTNEAADAPNKQQ